MAEPIKINSRTQVTSGKVEIDGQVWDIKLPGAATELRMSQAMRASKLWGSRIQSLEKKIDAGTVSDAELDKYEEYVTKYDENEKIIYGFFTSMFKDSTEDNSEVKKWVDETPSDVILMAFEDIKKAATNNDSSGTPASA